MTAEYSRIVGGKTFQAVVSDEQEALLGAYAAGRAVIGFIRKPGGDGSAASLYPAQYAVESLEDVDDELLERVIRRRYHMPWIIARTPRLIIREFTVEDAGDVLREQEDEPSDEVFYDEEKLASYIEAQYGFFEHGLWAVEAAGAGILLGKAGLERLDPDSWKLRGAAPLQLEYHIFTPYRGKGFALEACLAVLDYASHHFVPPIYAAVKSDNFRSASLIRKLGFQPAAREGILEKQGIDLYGWSWPVSSERDGPWRARECFLAQRRPV